jgi:hypothetical protein
VNDEGALLRDEKGGGQRLCDKNDADGGLSVYANPEEV